MLKEMENVAGGESGETFESAIDVNDVMTPSGTKEQVVRQAAYQLHEEVEDFETVAQRFHN